MLEEKSASLAQRDLNIAMIELSNSLTPQQRLHQSLILGVTQSLATRCSFTIETMKFAVNFASREMNFAGFANFAKNDGKLCNLSGNSVHLA